MSGLWTVHVEKHHVYLTTLTGPDRTVPEWPEWEFEVIRYKITIEQQSLETVSV